jgi:hypothetical protein
MDLPPRSPDQACHKCGRAGSRGLSVVRDWKKRSNPPGQSIAARGGGHVDSIVAATVPSDWGCICGCGGARWLFSSGHGWVTVLDAFSEIHRLGGVLDLSDGAQKSTSTSHNRV